jgi:hypothetical protein
MDRAAVIEVLDRAGQVRSVHKITRWPSRIGRSPHCEIVLDDGHLAPEHARLDWQAGPDEDRGGRDGEGGKAGNGAAEEGPGHGGAASLTLLPSLNGGWLGERRLAAGETAALPGMALFQLGSTQLRWRSTAEPLAPELPLERHQRRVHESRGLLLPALLLLWLGLLGFEQWTALNPGSPWINYSAAVLLPLAAVLGWAALWSLLTQLFQHRFPFSTHLWRALLGLTALQLLGNALIILAFAFSWPRLLALDAVAGPIGMAALLWWHASLVWPRARRPLAIGLMALLLLGGLLGVAKRQHAQHWFGPPYMSQLPPPALRLVEPKSPQQLIEALRPLEAELARQAARDKDGVDADNDEAE